MSASVGSDSNQDVELNLAPIIDCFTVLITYLLVTASFLTLASVDVSVSSTNPAPGAPPPATNAPPPMTMAMELKAGGEIGIQIRGGTEQKTIEFKVAPGPGNWDIPALNAKLQEIQKTYPTLNEVSVTAEPTVIYKDMVTVLHEIQNTMPKVYISG